MVSDQEIVERQATHHLHLSNTHPELQVIRLKVFKLKKGK